MLHAAADLELAHSCLLCLWKSHGMSVLTVDGVETSSQAQGAPIQHSGNQKQSIILPLTCLSESPAFRSFSCAWS